MNGLSISDSDEHGSLLHLREILHALAPLVRTCRWRSRHVWSMGNDAAEALNTASDNQLMLDGPVFLDLVSRVDQVVDGHFLGYLPGSTTAWIIIHAVDSTVYDVYCDDIAVSQVLLESFTTCTPVSDDADSEDVSPSV